ncbi:MAG: type III pantothenate kinase [Ruminococcus sp.]|jgi:type III pantothenate kinase|nr:type III pantothenate kinase [Ruminococcus sp.]
MMVLAINSGNEFTDIGVFESDKLTYKAQFVTPSACTADEYTVKLLSMSGEKKSFDGAVIADVSDIGAGVIKSAVKKFVGSGKVVVIGPGVKTGLNIRIDNPAALGANLVAAAAGAMLNYGYPVIIADMAAASAFTVIDGNGVVRGGALVPGFSLSLRALSDNTAQLPRVHVNETASYSVLGTNTESCMKSGIVYAAAAVIDGFVRRYRAVIGEDAPTILTGSYASIASKYCEEQVKIDSSLALVGLAAIYRRNIP